MKFYILDVFTIGSFTGNQLAVVLQDKEVSDFEMLSYTREFNFSETVFLKDWHSELPSIRIFTPGGELPFAGHPTIGTAWLINYLNDFKLSDFSISLKLGETAILSTKTSARLTFPSCPVLGTFSGNLESLMKYCDIEMYQIDSENVFSVNVGPEFVIIPVNSIEAITKAKTSLGFSEKNRIYLIHKISETEYKVRMFGMSLPEDPATGSAACALAGYLNQVKGQESGKITISQGMEIGRPSQINLNWIGSQIQVSGSVNLIASGELF